MTEPDPYAGWKQKMENYRIRMRAQMTLGEAQEYWDTPSNACACLGGPHCCVVMWPVSEDYKRATHIIAKLLQDAAQKKEDHFGPRTWEEMQRHLIEDHGLSPAFVSYENGPWPSIHAETHAWEGIEHAAEAQAILDKEDEDE